MKLVFTTLALISLFLFAPTLEPVAHAEKLCVKRRQTVRDGNKFFTKRLLRIADPCPKGTREVLDTTSFTGADGQDGTSPTYNLYEDVTTTTSDSTTSSTLGSVEEFDGFTKQRDDTVLKVTFTSMVFILNDGDVAGGADLQIRMNGRDSNNNTDTTYSRNVSASFTVYDQSLATGDESTKAFTIVGFFTGLSAGIYTPSLWAAVNDATRVTVNAGSKAAQTLIIEEIGLNS